MKKFNCTISRWKTDGTIWKPHFLTNPWSLSNFFMIPLFVWILKRTPPSPNFRGEETILTNIYFKQLKMQLLPILLFTLCHLLTKKLHSNLKYLIIWTQTNWKLQRYKNSFKEMKAIKKNYIWNKCLKKYVAECKFNEKIY